MSRSHSKPAASKSAALNQPTTSLTWPILGVIAALALVVLGIALAGRRNEQLPNIYGRRRGREAAGSVNGTAVLADLYRAAGRRDLRQLQDQPLRHPVLLPEHAGPGLGAV